MCGGDDAAKVLQRSAAATATRRTPDNPSMALLETGCTAAHTTLTAGYPRAPALCWAAALGGEGVWCSGVRTLGCCVRLAMNGTVVWRLS